MSELTRDQKIEKANKYVESYGISTSSISGEIHGHVKEAYVNGFLQGMEVCGGGLDVASEELLRRLKKAEQSAELADFIKGRFSDILELPKTASWEHVWEVTKSLKQRR